MVRRGGVRQRLVRFISNRLGQCIPPIDTLEHDIDERVTSGESEETVTLAVIEDFERSAATVNARTTPLVPTAGIVVTGAGILAKEGDMVAYVAYPAIAIALAGLGFLAAAVFRHAGRPSVGRVPTRADIACVHDRLLKKEADAQLGTLFLAIAFALVLVVLL